MWCFSDLFGTFQALKNQRKTKTFVRFVRTKKQQRIVRAKQCIFNKISIGISAIFFFERFQLHWWNWYWQSFGFLCLFILLSILKQSVCISNKRKLQPRQWKRKGEKIALRIVDFLGVFVSVLTIILYQNQEGHTCIHVISVCLIFLLAFISTIPIAVCIYCKNVWRHSIVR